MPQLVIEITVAVSGALWTLARALRLVLPLLNDKVAARAALVEGAKHGKR